MSGFFYRFVPAAVFVLSIAGAVQAQHSFAAVDAHARALDLRGDTLERLTEALIAPFSGEREQARAIFTWITSHVAYDCDLRPRRVDKDSDETIHPLYFTHLRLKTILERRRTQCDGYALLFKTMCNLAGLRATIVEGYARTGSGARFDPADPRSNHAWNAVCIDGEWYPVDVTFASGSCSGASFQRSLSDEYFMMTPEVEARRHKELYPAGAVQQNRPRF
jgi:hypothetical protein